MTLHQPKQPDEESIFRRAIELTGTEARNRFVETACGADAMLLAQVVALREAHEDASQFLEQPALATTLAVKGVHRSMTGGTGGWSVSAFDKDDREIGTAANLTI
jgi:hypothetical protein